MKWTILAAAAALTLAGPAALAAPAAPAASAKAAPANPKAVHDLLAALQAEKLLRMKAGMAHYANAQQRHATEAKIAAVPPEYIYTRLAGPVAQLVSTETATEMARFYQTSYGKKLVFGMYNGGPALYAADPKPTAAEAAELKRPAYLKANAEFQAARPALEHEAFVLVQQLANGK
jgi:hypothetical protein